MALAAMQIDKQSARQLLNSSLPVPSDVLMGHQKALAQIATKAHQQRIHVSSHWLYIVNGHPESSLENAPETLSVECSPQDGPGTNATSKATA